MNLKKIFNEFKQIENLSAEEKINIINKIRLELHKYSPLKYEPVDCVLWIKNDSVYANDYNPNAVAPPEMELLEHSIREDGYTQPIVAWDKDNNYEVIDGFHRNRVGREIKDISDRIYNYLPITIVNSNRTSRSDRIASTIRHNRARGKHKIDAMSDIVIELKNRNWTNERISKELGMDEDEILRLCQISGLEDLFKDEDFSKAWLIEDSEADEFSEFDGTVSEDEKDENKFRTANTSDPDRVFHTYDKWECFIAGFYNTTKDGKTAEQCEQEYYNILSDEDKFSDALEKIIVEWKNSCEHYLTNKAMNRLAWLGQAAVCYMTGVPARFSPGWHLLSDDQKNKANNIALKYLNKWLKKNNMDEVDIDSAISKGRQVEIY